MSSVRRIIIIWFSLVASLFINGNALGQWSVSFPGETVTMFDTLDYFPPYYDGALNYNLMIAASNGNSSEIIRLIKKGADINSETEEGATPLIFAVSNNKIRAVITLLAYKPDLNKRSKNFETPLHIAVKSRFFDITEALIREGADMDLSDNFGATPLHYAALYGYFEIVDLLLYYNASLNLKSAEGTTPLLASVWAGNPEISDLLIQNNADTESADNEGFTPLLLSAYFGDTLLIDILLKKGANLYAINNAKHNALSLAISTGDTVTAEYLLKKGDKWADQGKAVNLYSVASKYRRTNMADILKKNNIEGKLKHEIDQVSVSASARFSLHDNYTGLGISFRDSYFNGGFILGCDTKLWYSRVLVQESDKFFHQYMDKSSVAYAGVFKDFSLSDRSMGFNYSISAALTAGIAFGNSLKGTYIYPEKTVKAIPSVTFRMTKMNLSYYAGFDYLKTGFYKNGPVWIRIGLSYNYSFDKIRVKIKPVRWE
jgi:ankyrin repeat protein